jgi:long-chain acyl-CoA synthetase
MDQTINSTNKATELTGFPSVDKPWLKYYPEGAAEAVQPIPGKSIYENLLESNVDNLQRVALEYFGTKITYRQLFRKIDTLSSALSSYGIRQGDSCLLCLPNIPEIVFFIYALNKIGATACLLDPRTNAEGILERAEDAQAKLVVVVYDIVEEKILPFADQYTAQKIIVCTPGDSATGIHPKSVMTRIVYGMKR